MSLSDLIIKLSRENAALKVQLDECKRLLAELELKHGINKR